MIILVPPDTPVATPVEAPIAATVLLLLVHMPPVVASLKVDVLPWHIVVVPVIGRTLLTVKVTDVVQPAMLVYFMIAVPVDTPVTKPVVMPMVAMAVLLLLHVPPGVASLNIVVFPRHIEVVPVIGAIGYTDTVVAA